MSEVDVQQPASPLRTEEGAKMDDETNAANAAENEEIFAKKTVTMDLGVTEQADADDEISVQMIDDDKTEDQVPDITGTENADIMTTSMDEIEELPAIEESQGVKIVHMEESKEVEKEELTEAEVENIPAEGETQSAEIEVENIPVEGENETAIEEAVEKEEELVEPESTQSEDQISVQVIENEEEQKTTEAGAAEEVATEIIEAALPAEEIKTEIIEADEKPAEEVQEVTTASEEILTEETQKEEEAAFELQAPPTPKRPRTPNELDNVVETTVIEGEISAATPTKESSEISPKRKISAEAKVTKAQGAPSSPKHGDDSIPVTPKVPKSAAGSTPGTPKIPADGAPSTPKVTDETVASETANAAGASSPQVAKTRKTSRDSTAGTPASTKAFTFDRKLSREMPSSPKVAPQSEELQKAPATPKTPKTPKSAVPSTPKATAEAATPKAVSEVKVATSKAVSETNEVSSPRTPKTRKLSSQAQASETPQSIKQFTFETEQASATETKEPEVPATPKTPKSAKTKSETLSKRKSETSAAVDVPVTTEAQKEESTPAETETAQVETHEGDMGEGEKTVETEERLTEEEQTKEGQTTEEDVEQKEEVHETAEEEAVSEVISEKESVPVEVIEEVSTHDEHEEHPKLSPKEEIESYAAKEDESEHLEAETAKPLGEEPSERPRTYISEAKTDVGGTALAQAPIERESYRPPAATTRPQERSPSPVRRSRAPVAASKPYIHYDQDIHRQKGPPPRFPSYSSFSSHLPVDKTTYEPLSPWSQDATLKYRIEYSDAPYRAPTNYLQEFDDIVKTGAFSVGLYSTNRLLERSRSRARERRNAMRSQRSASNYYRYTSSYGTAPLRSRDYSTPPTYTAHRPPSRSGSFISFLEYSGAKQYELSRSLSRSSIFDRAESLSRASSRSNIDQFYNSGRLSRVDSYVNEMSHPYEHEFPSTYETYHASTRSYTPHRNYTSPAFYTSYNTPDISRTTRYSRDMGQVISSEYQRRIGELERSLSRERITKDRRSPPPSSDSLARIYSGFARNWADGL